MKTTVNFKQPDAAENIEMPGIRMTVILSTECSGGKLTIIEDEVNVGAGSPTYTCNREDKVILVNEGKFMISANGEQYLAEKGCNIFIPKGTMHNFKNVGTVTGKLLITLTPGGHEHFLKDLSQSVKVFGQNYEVMNNVARKYDVVMA
ncbi:cupin domain-containing protein [Mucilaginibacter conchicola]|uniref:Cupin domain-containing protein n=1 Tax=Mucilaginibacter conchicola TaxID=2303333 RepID=A0A372NUS2_9SPHI|nr:cupin domain-containing protein [Mucilaginibacter conchicola]RFZ92774.1 cupin domain-containing protein [Mucilaginibacter conchicola]